MPVSTVLPTREAYVNDLIPVAICSAADPCHICWNSYTKAHEPVLLRPCGHIFGNPCIQQWFEEGANTCPFDRNKLFMSTTDAEETESWSLVPFGALQDQGGRGAPASDRRGGITNGTYVAPEQYLFFGGEIIGINSRLTLEGCRRVVRDLWYVSNHLYHQIRHHADDHDPLSVSEDTLRESIHDALPRGIDVDDHAWPLLFSMARSMVASRGMAWEQGSEANMRREDMMGWGEELWRVCGGVQNRD